MPNSNSWFTIIAIKQKIQNIFKRSPLWHFIFYKSLPQTKSLKKHILQQGLHKEVLMTLPFSRFRTSVMLLLLVINNYELSEWYSLQYRKHYFNIWYWKSHMHLDNHVSTWWAHTPTLSFEDKRILTSKDNLHTKKQTNI